MTDNPTRIDPKRLEEILQIAPFHRWLGLIYGHAERAA